MTLSNIQVRRATVDDLVVLRRLWQQRQLEHAHLEKRLTEFQIVETPEGEVLGAIGLQVQGHHGRIHSEAYAQLELASDLRPRLWDRVQSVARNHGLVWLWIENGTAMFWLEKGFEAATSDVLEKLPVGFADQPGQQWLVLKLREEPSAAQSIEHELAAFRQAHNEQSARVVRQARVLRLLAVVVVLIVLALMAWAGMFILRNAPRTPGPSPQLTQ